MRVRIFIDLADGPQRSAIRRALLGTRDIRLVSGAANADVVVRESNPYAPERGHASDTGAVVFSPAALPPGSGVPGDALTPRERDVLLLLASGHGNADIAGSLGVSTSTVKFHLGAIYAKLGVHTRTEAVSAGIRLGMISV